MTIGSNISIEDMDMQENFSKNGAPLFDGNNYTFWRIRMRVFPMAQGYDIWHTIENGYTTPKTRPKYSTSKKLNKNNARALNAILSGLS